MYELKEISLLKIYFQIKKTYVIHLKIQILCHYNI